MQIWGLMKKSSNWKGGIAADMRPNIFLIVSDSLRYDHVGPQPGKPSLTPNLDRLANEGVVFSQVIAQGPSTRVSMSAMLSSTYASLHGGEQELSPSRPVVQQILKDSGYTTAGITSNLYLSQAFGWQRGFDVYDDCRPEAVYQRRIWLRLINQVTKRLGWPLIWPRALPAELVFENAQRALTGLNSPFFMWVHLMDTHWPYWIQKFSWNPKIRQQRQKDLKIRPRLVADRPQLSQDEIQELVEQYRESVRYTDQHIGAFVERLKAQGLRKNSWIFITADHGEEFLEHGRLFHHPTPYEELIHVPLIVLPPEELSRPFKKHCAEQVRLIDLVPTFIELAQAAPGPETRLFGESLLPFIWGETRPEPRPAITESPHNQFLSIRSGCWKYILDVNADKGMLFNLEQDPGEKVDLAAQEASIAENFYRVLQEHLEMVRKSKSNGHEEESSLELEPELLERLRGLGYVE